MAAETIAIDDVAPEIIEAFSQGKLEGTVIKLSEGIEFPLEIACTGDLLQFERTQTSSSLRILQTVYIRNDSGQFMLSRDGLEWKPLFDFVKGNISVGIGNYEGELKANINAELNRR
jgi:hypothetical protein